jgi:hypothetical protein
VGTGHCLSHSRVALQPLGFDPLALLVPFDSKRCLDNLDSRSRMDIDRQCSVLSKPRVARGFDFFADPPAREFAAL